MVKDFYLVYSQRFDPAKGYSKKEYWNSSNAMVIVETSESKAIKKARESGHWITEDILSCFKLDTKKYKIGDVVIHDYGDDG